MPEIARVTDDDNADVVVLWWLARNEPHRNVPSSS